MTGGPLGYPLNEWASLLNESKGVFNWPDWQTPRVFVEGKRAAAKAGRSRFVSHETERCRLHVQLMDKSGASIEGAEVCLMMWRYRPMEDMSAILSVAYEGKSVCICRVDVRPAAPHINKHWRRFGGPSEINGSHVHQFSDNATLGRKAFDPFGNLPQAVPLHTEPDHLRDFLQVVERAFNVDGLTTLHPPPTQESLL
ncbi:hypothetical protein CFIICLFH_1336 [Methylobacterium goesingense]|nr:hypothetical protein CFIICLFH_1336 [Methylobacterium goesingense]